MDQRFQKLFESERKLSAVFGYFTGFAVVIACLGLFGLASFTAEKRTREIGIRKVLGASAGSAVFLLLRDFVKWVVLANVLAWPVVYFLIQRWLQNYAYRTTPHWEIFALSGGAALFIAVLTVIGQSLRAALTNPSKILRYE